MVVDSRLLLLCFLVLNIEQKLKYYNDKKRAAEAAIEATLKKIRKQNEEAAKAEKKTLQEWHKIMSDTGNASAIMHTETDPTNEKVAIESARWIGDYHARISKGVILKRKR